MSPMAAAYRIDMKQVTVSGLSSGAYMAEQMQVAYSDVFSGLGVFAGGPYNCALGSLAQATAGCSSAQYSPPLLSEILLITRNYEKQGLIAPTVLLKNSKFYFYRGRKDPIISEAVAKQALSFFEKMGVPQNQILFSNDIQGGHGMPTLDFGNSCETGDESPFINNCSYDGAGEMFKQLYGSLQAKTKAIKENLISLSQMRTGSEDLAIISMSDQAKAYVPTACRLGARCRLHVAFHGCRQTIDDIQDQFYFKAGYNEWAESNHIIVLYPQAERNVFLGNPKGCWDWWGYTGNDYATRQGPQLQVVMHLIHELSEK